MTEQQPFEPDWVSPPGDTIADALEELKMSQADLAQRSGFTRKHINGLIRGRVAITAEAALKLEAVLGEPASFWLRRESHYREALARRTALVEASDNKAWLRELPLKWMSQRGWLPGEAESREDEVAQCLRFFGVASVPAWREACAAPVVAFRAAPKAKKQIGAVAAWLRKAHLDAAQIESEPFNKTEFEHALPELRRLTREADPKVFVPRLQQICAGCGVAVVLVPAPPGCPVHGATRWIAPDKALLALTLRYKTNDQLWFSFFHEAGHILKHGKRLLVIEGLDGVDTELEEEANRFAADLLIPPAAAQQLRRLRSIAEVDAFAKSIDVAPGIAVGRMQKEGWIDWSKMNGLKTRYGWT